MLTHYRAILANPRLLIMLVLGFSSGLPLALVGSTLQAWFTQTGVDLSMIGAISLIGMPYTLKFLWAPVMDQFSIPYLGKRRGWIWVTQVCLAVFLIILAMQNPADHAGMMAMIALIIAFFSASQDIAIDAYRTDVLHADERGLGSAYYVFAYRIATLLAGGLALIFADHMGWRWTYLLMSAGVLLSLCVSLIAPRLHEVKAATPHLLTSIRAALVDFLNRDKFLLLLLFIMLYKIGDALALQLMSNFLLKGLGFTLTDVGIAYKVTGFIATILGVFLGGLVLTSWSVYRALLWFGILQALSNFMFVILSIVGKHFGLMCLSIFIENFCSGLTTAAFMAFLMSLCHQQFTATQFALLSAVASIGRVFLGPVAATIVQHAGWTDFYMIAFVVSFPGLVCLLLLKNEVYVYAPATMD